MGNYIFRLLKNASSIDDPYLNNLLKKNRINSLDNDEQIMNKMGNDMDSLIDYSIKSIYSLAKSENTKVVAVFLPTIKDKNIDIEYKYISNLCNKHQIELIDLSKIYVKTNKKELYISEVDFHPNNKANKIIAKHLYDSIVIHQNYFNFDTIK
jgi:lysophospholipase L1-like esterase